MSAISNDDLYRLFSELKAEAKTLLEDPARAEKVLDEGEARLQENRVLRDAAKDIPELAAFARNCISGKYTGASESSVTAEDSWRPLSVPDGSEGPSDGSSFENSSDSSSSGSETSDGSGSVYRSDQPHFSMTVVIIAARVRSLFRAA